MSDGYSWAWVSCRDCHKVWRCCVHHSWNLAKKRCRGCVLLARAVRLAEAEDGKASPTWEECYDLDDLHDMELRLSDRIDRLIEASQSKASKGSEG